MARCPEPTPDPESWWDATYATDGPPVPSAEEAYAALLAVRRLISREAASEPQEEQSDG